MSPYLRPDPTGVYIQIKVQPRARKNEIGEALGNELRVKVTAPPVDAAANEALLRFLAEKLQCPRRSVQLVRGQTSRHKLIRVENVSAEEVEAKLK